jgi:hypothetical protein
VTVTRIEDVGSLAHQFAVLEHEHYAPAANAAALLALMVENGEVEFCCDDAKREPVAWFSWYPWRLLCQTHAMASDVENTATEAGVVCVGCGTGPLRGTDDRATTVDTVRIPLTDDVLIVGALCELCPKPPG